MADDLAGAAADPLERLFADGPARPPVVIVVEAPAARVDDVGHPLVRFLLVMFVLWCVVSLLVDEYESARTGEVRKAPRR